MSLRGQREHLVQWPPRRWGDPSAERGPETTQGIAVGKPCEGIHEVGMCEEEEGQRTASLTSKTGLGWGPEKANGVPVSGRMTSGDDGDDGGDGGDAGE